MDVAKIGLLEKGTRLVNKFDVVREKPLDLSIQSRNLPFCGKSFYLDLPHNKGSQILTGAIKKLGGVIESFLSKEVTYVVSRSSEARPGDATDQWTDRKNSVAITSLVNRAVKPAALTKPTLSNSPVSSGLDEQRRSQVVNNPKHISRGKELLHKAIWKKDGGTSILANARSWGVHILHVNEVLDYLEKLSVVAKSLPAPTKVEAVASSGCKTRKVAQLKSPFLKIEDQSRQFRPLHFHFQSFPQLNILAARGYSLFELTSPRSSYKDQPSKAKTVDAECYMTHSETEEKSPKGKPTIAAKKRRKGYCECCQEAFEELIMHLRSEQHLRFALDNTQYALVDQIISQFSFDFIVQSPDLSNSRLSASNSVGSTSLGSTVPQLAEVKVISDGLDTGRNSLKADNEERLVSDFLRCNVTGVKSNDDTRVMSTVTIRRAIHPPLPARDLYHTMERSDGRKEMSFRALLESGEKHAGKEVRNTRGELTCSDGHGTFWLHDALQRGTNATTLCDNGLTDFAVPKSVAVLQADSAILKINIGKLQQGCEGQKPTLSEFNEISLTRKRKRLDQQSHQSLKRRAFASGACYSEPDSLSCPQRPPALAIETIVPDGCSSDLVSPRLRHSSQAMKRQIFLPGGCSSDPVSTPSQLIPQTVKRRSHVPGICCSGPIRSPHHQENDYLALVVGTKSAPIPTDTKANLKCRTQKKVVQHLMEFPTVSCISAAPHSVEAHHTLPKDLQHYEQLLGHWECFSPSVDMPSGMNESRDDWDLSPLIPQGHKRVEKDLNLSCNTGSPTVNSLSSTCCRNPTQGLSVLQHCMKQKDSVSTPSAFPVCPSECSVSLVFQESIKKINILGEANLSCFQIAPAWTSGVIDGTSLPAGEMFSSASDWDVPLLSRLDNLHAIKTAPLDVEVLRRTSVSMQDTGYESHLCSVLKPKSEFDWSFKEEGNHVNCWAEAESVPYTVLGTCLNGWAS